MNDTNIDVQNGYNQIAPNATNQIQNFYGFDFAEKLLKTKECPLTLVVLGAGVDATLGLPTSSSLVPRIVEYLESDEGKAVDAALRKAIGNVRFHFDKFVNNAIDRLAKDLDKELLTICRNITEELNHNSSLSDDQRKLGNLIIRLFGKIIDIKKGAAIDAETEMLIEEVLGTTVKDDTIIDFTHINYTETFKSIIVEILQKSMYEAENPILCHVYKNILDIEQLLSNYFYGFYTGQISYVRDYLYISWILWAYLVNEEQRMVQQENAQADKPNLYAQLKNFGSQQKDATCQLLTFNYTSYASQSSDTALYFHGSLTEYVDVENKNDFKLENLQGIDIEAFFKNQLASEISFDPDRKSLPIPSFMPPLKLQTVISRKYIDIWYQASQMLLRANRIIILGYSFSSPDNFFCDYLRENRDAQVVIIDKNIDAVSRNVCRILQLMPNRYSRQVVNGIEHRRYDNRVTIIGADLAEIDLDKYGR